MIFPTGEPEIKQFADQMIGGYLKYGVHFPHVNRAKFAAARWQYSDARKAFTQARSQMRIAGRAKNKRLSELVKIMHNCLKKSEVDVADNPEKLKQIGWSPKDRPQPSEIPSQPLNLRITFKDGQTIKLKWNRPDDSTRIRNYIIERRQAQCGNWQPVGVSYRTEMNLANQPVNVLLEYRVRAVNLAGESMPSNTVSVVLS